MFGVARRIKIFGIEQVKSADPAELFGSSEDFETASHSCRKNAPNQFVYLGLSDAKAPCKRVLCDIHGVIIFQYEINIKKYL